MYRQNNKTWEQTWHNNPFQQSADRQERLSQGKGTQEDVREWALPHSVWDYKWRDSSSFSFSNWRVHASGSLFSWNTPAGENPSSSFIVRPKKTGDVLYLYSLAERIRAHTEKLSSLLHEEGDKWRALAEKGVRTHVARLPSNPHLAPGPSNGEVWLEIEVYQNGDISWGWADPPSDEHELQVLAREAPSGAALDLLAFEYLSVHAWHQRWWKRLHTVLNLLYGALQTYLPPAYSPSSQTACIHWPGGKVEYYQSRGFYQHFTLTGQWKSLVQVTPETQFWELNFDSEKGPITTYAELAERVEEDRREKKS